MVNVYSMKRTIIMTIVRFNPCILSISQRQPCPEVSEPIFSRSIGHLKVYIYGDSMLYIRSQNPLGKP